MVFLLICYKELPNNNPYEKLKELIKKNNIIY